ncbi:MAG: sulfite exporter TauE/SafE family protein [Chitinophagales bacterium]|nr:sulfite exporter TauE/SafE family protein [Chitinophagales bacterium]MCZ2392350.1 sulfite exporter TauE/SafE family protein [Chitinophagales bacterium]
MDFFPILTGLSIGLLGSLHCIGMCGPIALSLPVHQMPPVQKFANIFLYNLGRALTYAAMGGILGWLGSSFQIFGFQQFLSILGGVLILILAWFYQYRPAFLSSGKLGVKVSMLLGQQMKKQKSFSTFLTIGLLNGLLPCGLVYMALVSAFATGSIGNAAILMFFFGLGTLPLMSILVVSSQWLKASVKSYFKKIIPIWIVFMGVLMILRGMNLGIPYISPSFNADANCVEKCCEH